VAFRVIVVVVCGSIAAPLFGRLYPSATFPARSFEVALSRADTTAVASAMVSELCLNGLSIMCTHGPESSVFVVPKIGVDQWSAVAETTLTINVPGACARP